MDSTHRRGLSIDPSCCDKQLTEFPSPGHAANAIKNATACLITAESGTSYLQSTNAVCGRTPTAAEPLDLVNTDRSTAFGGGGG